jgi:hypothetical protein
MLDFLKKTEDKQENYWALLIEPEWITSSIWNITDGKVKVVSTSPATRWEEDLIEPIDTSLSACTQNLPDDFPDPTKTVFGVPNSWLLDGNIKEEYLEKLKKICTDLSLVPSGFVVLSEAISHFIKQEEESPLSGIVVGISNEAFDISIFDVGKLVGTTTVLRSVSVEEDMIEGISRLGSEMENLPSRIILFNQKEQELEEVKNILNDVDWDKAALTKFVHPPKIEILEPSKKIMAVALAGGSELGEVTGMVESADNEVEQDTELKEMPIEELNNFEEPKDVTAEDLGFSVGPINSEPKVEEAVYVPQVRKIPEFPKFNFKKPEFKLPHFKFNFGGTKPLIMLGSLILTIFVTGFILCWFLPKATVTIFVAPKKLEESIVLAVGTDIESDKIEVSVSGEKTKSTTGTKTVGDRAKGQVKVQNGTAFPINLPVGTALISSSDLKFVTLKAASVSGALSPSSPGTATLDVEAASIGSEFNLNKDEVFKVGNYPKAEVDATSVETFTGGSSRQISAVSDDDRKKILKELKDELLSEAKQKLNEKITADMLLVEASFNEELVEEDYSNKVGDEATNLKLNLSLKITSTAVSKNKLSEISRRSLEDKIPSGFVLRDDQINYSFGTSEDEDKFDVNISANLLPSIDTIEVAKRIAGRYPTIAEEYLGSIAGFTSAEIKMAPTLNGSLGTLPHISKNIEVIITAE